MFKRLMLAASVVALSTIALAQGNGARTVVTVDGGAGNLSAQSVNVSVRGGKAQVTGFRKLGGEDTGLQLLILIDDSARQSLSLQYDDVKKFLMSLPPTTEVGVAYMQSGGAQFQQEFTTNRAAAAAALHITGGIAGSNGSPYFVLSDALKRWGPERGVAQHPGAVRREVLMLTNGVEVYDSGRFTPDNPYVRSAISDAQRAGVIVYAIYVRDVGLGGQADAEANNGQNYLVQLTEATGGRTYYTGSGSSTNFKPYLEDVRKRLDNQYELTFTCDAKGNPLGIKVKVSGAKVSAAQEVYRQ